MRVLSKGFAAPEAVVGNRPRRRAKLAIQRWIAVISVAGCALTITAQNVLAQGKDTFTPMPLDSGFGRMDISDPPIPAEQIIKEFSVKESAFQDALNHYTYRRTAKVDEVDDDSNKVTGEWYEVDDVIFD